MLFSFVGDAKDQACGGTMVDRSLWQQAPYFAGTEGKDNI